MGSANSNTESTSAGINSRLGPGGGQGGGSQPASQPARQPLPASLSRRPLHREKKGTPQSDCELQRLRENEHRSIFSLKGRKVLLIGVCVTNGNKHSQPWQQHHQYSFWFSFKQQTWPYFGYVQQKVAHSFLRDLVMFYELSRCTPPPKCMLQS